jgi:hypothetical protein
VEEEGSSADYADYADFLNLALNLNLNACPALRGMDEFGSDLTTETQRAQRSERGYWRGKKKCRTGNKLNEGTEEDRKKQ